MGKIFTLEDSVKGIITNALDDLITELGKNCRLVYPSKMERCENCCFDPIGKKSTNIWLNGGPIPFQNTSCPMCDGSGHIAIPQSEITKFLCAFTPKSFFAPVPNLDLKSPFSIVQTKGFIDPDLAKVRRAQHMVCQVPLEGIISKKYELASDPADVANIIQNRYFVATWKQIS